MAESQADKDKREKDEREKKAKEEQERTNKLGPDVTQPIAGEPGGPTQLPADEKDRARKAREAADRPTQLPAPGEPGRTDALREKIAEEVQLLTDSQLDSVYQYVHSQVGR